MHFAVQVQEVVAEIGGPARAVDDEDQQLPVEMLERRAAFHRRQRLLQGVGEQFFLFHRVGGRFFGRLPKSGRLQQSERSQAKNQIAQWPHVSISLRIKMRSQTSRSGVKGASTQL